MNLNNLIAKYIDDGYSLDYASSKVAQDIILLKLSKSGFASNVTIKGGVVMHNISNDKRRATRDLDLDFIKYSLDNKSIINFINKINRYDDGIKITIIDKIERLNHQDYNGKRVYIQLKDSFSNIISTKLDIGVHKDFLIEQEEFVFDLSVLGESAKLLINSKEQIFVEKMKSLLLFGIISTRYKDIFDFYYLINYGNMNTQKIKMIIKYKIIDDPNNRFNDLNEIYNRLNQIFSNKQYLKNIQSSKVKWIDESIDEIVKRILGFIYDIKDK